MRNLLTRRARSRLGLSEESEKTAAQEARNITDQESKDTAKTVRMARLLSENMRVSREQNHYAERISIALASPARKR